MVLGSVPTPNSKGGRSGRLHVVLCAPADAPGLHDVCPTSKPCFAALPVDSPSRVSGLSGLQIGFLNGGRRTGVGFLGHLLVSGVPGFRSLPGVEEVSSQAPPRASLWSVLLSWRKWRAARRERVEVSCPVSQSFSCPLLPTRGVLPVPTCSTTEGGTHFHLSRLTPLGPERGGPWGAAHGAQGRDPSLG